MRNPASTDAANSVKRDVGNAWRQPVENTRVEDKRFKFLTFKPGRISIPPGFSFKSGILKILYLYTIHVDKRKTCQKIHILIAFRPCSG